MLSYCYTSASHWRDDFMAWCPNNVLAIWSLWSPSKLKLQQPVLLRTTTSILRDIALPFIFVNNSNYNVNIVMAFAHKQIRTAGRAEKKAVLFIFNSLKRILGHIFFH